MMAAIEKIEFRAAIEAMRAIRPAVCDGLGGPRALWFARGGGTSGCCCCCLVIVVFLVLARFVFTPEDEKRCVHCCRAGWDSQELGPNSSSLP